MGDSVFAWLIFCPNSSFQNEFQIFLIHGDNALDQNYCLQIPSQFNVARWHSSGGWDVDTGWMFLPGKQQSFSRGKTKIENLYPLTCSCLELEYEILISFGYFVITKHVEKSQLTKDGSAEQKDVVESLSHLQLFCSLLDCSPPGFSVHEIFQPRILEWVAMSFSRGSS